MDTLHAYFDILAHPTRKSGDSLRIFYLRFMYLFRAFLLFFILFSLSTKQSPIYHLETCKCFL
jgi:hypothetical protein